MCVCQRVYKLLLYFLYVVVGVNEIMKSSDEGGELYGGGGAMEFAKNYTGLSPPVIVALATIVIGGIVLLIGRAFRRSEEEPATQSKIIFL